MQKTLRRLRLVATIAAVATATGCMGSFALTKMVYGWNESVTGNKIINNVIFWGLNILPVYSIAVTVDVVILNTIEFWTGTKLIADASVEGDTRVAVSERDDGALVVIRGAVVYTLIPESADQILALRALVALIDQIDTLTDDGHADAAASSRSSSDESSTH